MKIKFTGEEKRNVPGLGVFTPGQVIETENKQMIEHPLFEKAKKKEGDK